MLNIMKWIGTVSSIIGAFIVAGKFFFTGYCFFVVGAIIWLLVAYIERDKALMTLNCFYFLANVLGLYNNFNA